MGAMAVGLGVVAVIGANWEDIPAWLKLAADLLLTGLCAAFVFVAWQRQQAWPREIGALLLFGLVIGGIALVGQVYQLQSDPWLGLATWLALCTPFLALLALSRLGGAVERRAALMLLGVSFAAWAAALALALSWSGVQKVGFQAMLGLLFIVYWSAIGWLAARGGQRVLFGLAFSVIGLRLLILYFQAIGGLSATGLGLIGGGALCLALAWAGWRLTRRLAVRQGAIP